MDNIKNLALAIKRISDISNSLQQEVKSVCRSISKNTNDPLFTEQQAAEQIGISITTLQDYVDLHRITCVREGCHRLYPKSEIDALKRHIGAYKELGKLKRFNSHR